MPVEQQAPEVLAFILVDHAYRDEDTGKFFLLGTRSVIAAATFPHEHELLAIYAVLTDGRGETTIQVRIVDAENERPPVLEHEAVVDFSDPLEETELVFLLTEIIFPEPGDYRLRLYGVGQMLCERQLLVMALENPANP